MPYGVHQKMPDYLAGLADAIAQLEEATGFKVDHKQAIEPHTTFRQWCEQLGQEGLKVDGHKFDLSKRPALAWVYDQVPTTREKAYRFTLVTMKAAQVGFTVMEMLIMLYMGMKFGAVTVGSFMPDQANTDFKSSKRFIEIVRKVPAAYQLMRQDAKDGSGRKHGEGNVRVRQMGECTMVFSWTSGRATTESIPMDVVMFDEVQEMTLEQIEKASERLSASEFKFRVLGSTANWPDEDIHHWYKLGTMHQFHTECPTCGARKPLDEYFPDCIRFDEARGAWRYVCQAGHWIDDSQRGEWIPVNEAAGRGEAPILSLHFPQTLSTTISPGEIMFAYNTAESMKNFYNRKLGKPYLDPSQVPVTLEHLSRCVEAGRAAGIQWKTRATGAYMGIDQMGNYNVVVIKERLPDGRQAVIHVEEIYSEDPFDRCDELMRNFGVAACCVELNPNYNDVKRFANRHRGRVFIGNSFGALTEGMVVWGDAPKLDVSERRTSEEERDRYVFRMDQYKCMQVSMARFCAKQPLCLFPDPQGLTQEVIDKGVRQMAAVLPRAFTHFTKTALVAEKDEETNQYKRVVKKIGIDPHFSYANMLCDVAWARAHGTSSFIVPEVSNVSTTRDKAADRNLHGLPSAVVTAMEPPPIGEVCGRCTAFNADTGMCTERQLSVLAPDPGCVLFVAAE